MKLDSLDPEAAAMADGLGGDHDELLPPSAQNPFKRDRRSVDMPHQQRDSQMRRYTPDSKQRRAKGEQFASPRGLQYAQRRPQG